MCSCAAEYSSYILVCNDLSLSTRHILNAQEIIQCELFFWSFIRSLGREHLFFVVLLFVVVVVVGAFGACGVWVCVLSKCDCARDLMWLGATHTHSFARYIYHLFFSHSIQSFVCSFVRISFAPLLIVDCLCIVYLLDGIWSHHRNKSMIILLKWKKKKKVFNKTKWTMK